MQDHNTEEKLSDSVQEALRQIDEKNYETALLAKGIPKKRIRKYGFAFCGKKYLLEKAGKTEGMWQNGLNINAECGKIM